jgi:hypothetical protein
MQTNIEKYKPTRGGKRELYIKNKKKRKYICILFYVNDTLHRKRIIYKIFSFFHLLQLVEDKNKTIHYRRRSPARKERRRRRRRK